LPAILSNPVQYLVQLAQSASGRTIIGLAGLPGAGKSTIIQHWQSEVNRLAGSASLKVLGMDGFHFSKQQLQQLPDPEAAFARRGAPWTFDAPGFQYKILELQAGYGKKSVYWPDFAHDVGDPVADAIMIPATTRIVLVEGLYVLYRQDDWRLLQGCFAETWYLDTDMDVAMTRLLQRHQQAWQLSEPDAQARIDNNDYKNALLVLATREQADYLIADIN